MKSSCHAVSCSKYSANTCSNSWKAFLCSPGACISLTMHHAFVAMELGACNKMLVIMPSAPNHKLHHLHVTHHSCCLEDLLIQKWSPKAWLWPSHFCRQVAVNQAPGFILCRLCVLTLQPASLSCRGDLFGICLTAANANNVSELLEHSV